MEVMRDKDNRPLILFLLAGQVPKTPHPSA
jgi:hypothetical protein